MTDTVISLDDDEGNRLHATWSRSGKRLIVTVTRTSTRETRQIELLPEQVEQVRAFLAGPSA